MKVVLVGNYANDEQQSMQRFTASLERGLTEAGHEVRTLRPRSVVGRLSPSWRGIGKWLGYVDKFGIFPRDLKASLKWADVVHICDQASSIYTKDIGYFPHIVTCHDVLAIRSAMGEIPHVRTRWSGKLLQRAILNGLNRAQHIVCVSEATRSDLIRIAKISDQDISLVYNSLNYPYSRMEDPELAIRLHKLRIDPSESFLLHVGGNQWYKNRLGVLRIFAHLRKLTPYSQLKLVMVGKPWTEEMRRYITVNGLSDVSIELHNIENEDLRALYSKATLMLFPSLQEGFGWPIIEAQACGCPVVTSNRPPMNEIGGSGAIYINPEDERLAAFALKSVLSSISTMRSASLQNAARFKELAMIHGYVSAYKKVQKRCYASQQSLVATLN
jgi:glycosyltransferase involved in cell wall biosynthesis